MRNQIRSTGDRATTKDVHDRPRDPQAESIHGSGRSKTGREEERETRIVFKRQADGENCKFRETITRVEVVTPQYVRQVDRGSRIHWLACLYTISEATKRLETTQVWISPGPEYATRISIPLRVDSGVAKNLLARRHFNEILERNPELQMHTTYGSV